MEAHLKLGVRACFPDEELLRDTTPNLSITLKYKTLDTDHAQEHGYYYFTLLIRTFTTIS